MIIYSNGKHTVPIIGGRKIKSLDGIDWNSLHHHPIHSIAMQMTIQTIKLIKIPFYSASIYPFPSIQMIKVFYFLSSLWFFNCYMSQSLLGSSLTTPSLSLPREGFSISTLYIYFSSSFLRLPMNMSNYITMLPLLILKI